MSWKVHESDNWRFPSTSPAKCRREGTGQRILVWKRWWSHCLPKYRFCKSTKSRRKRGHLPYTNSANLRGARESIMVNCLSSDSLMTQKLSPQYEAVIQLFTVIDHGATFETKNSNLDNDLVQIWLRRRRTVATGRNILKIRCMFTQWDFCASEKPLSPFVPQGLNKANLIRGLPPFNCNGSANV